MQVAMVLENLALQEERIQQVQLRKELAMAREIQESFLPTNFNPVPGGGYELFATVYPAREVSGDRYDFFPLDDGRLAFFVGDVSGKGLSAALFMLAAQAGRPAYHPHDWRGYWDFGTGARHRMGVARACGQDAGTLIRANRR
jgi:serine phosphatase RsbU (regulator of sigma subunit)